MVKTCGRRSLVFCFSFFLTLGRSVNTVLAIFGLVGGLEIGVREGFDTVIIFGCLLFSFLLAGELIEVFLIKSEKILKSAMSNLVVTILKFVWLLLAAFLLYGLFWDGGLAKYYWVYLFVAMMLIIMNLPSMIFHAVFCVLKFR